MASRGQRATRRRIRNAMRLKATKKAGEPMRLIRRMKLVRVGLEWAWTQPRTEASKGTAALSSTKSASHRNRASAATAAAKPRTKRTLTLILESEFPLSLFAQGSVYAQPPVETNCVSVPGEAGPA